MKGSAPQKLALAELLWKRTTVSQEWMAQKLAMGPVSHREAAQADSMPGSNLAKACAYVLGQWPKLVRVFDYGEVELDTNWAENSVRPLVLGRKNWLHVGSWDAGPRVAAIASVIESSKRLAINPREYLADVLPRLANGTTSEVPSLTPAAWLRHRSGQPAA